MKLNSIKKTVLDFINTVTSQHRIYVVGIKLMAVNASHTQLPIRSVCRCCTTITGSATAAKKIVWEGLGMTLNAKHMEEEKQLILKFP